MTATTKKLAEGIDALLPQTQCQLCEFDGCMPYAHAIAKGEVPIDRCLPGGLPVLDALGKHLNIDPQPYRDALRKKTKPPSQVVIQEDACIGCTKCLRVCPTDAIIGASKQMHTVIADACTGCDLCIPTCPVDCIDSIPLSDEIDSDKKDHWRKRHQQRQARLEHEKQFAANTHEKAKLSSDEKNQTIAARQDAIRAAVARVKSRKS